MHTHTKYTYQKRQGNLYFYSINICEVRDRRGKINYTYNLKDDRLQNRRKYLQKKYLIKDCIQNIQRTIKTQQVNNLIKTWAKDFNSYLTKENIWMASKHMKNVPYHVLSGKCKLCQLKQ